MIFTDLGFQFLSTKLPTSPTAHQGAGWKPFLANSAISCPAAVWSSGKAMPFQTSGPRRPRPQGQEPGGQDDFNQTKMHWFGELKWFMVWLWYVCIIVDKLAVKLLCIRIYIYIYIIYYFIYNVSIRIHILLKLPFGIAAWHCRLGLPFGRCKNMKQLQNVETHTLLSDRGAPKSNSLS